MRIGRLTMTVMAAAALTAGLASCAGTAPIPTRTIIHDVPEPVTVRLSELANRDIDLPRGTDLNIVTDGQPVTGWSAVFSVKGIAEFDDGAARGGMELDPGITPTKDGVTEVSLRRGVASAYRFRLHVTG